MSTRNLGLVLVLTLFLAVMATTATQARALTSGASWSSACTLPCSSADTALHPTAASSGSCVNFSGTWNTDFGTMRLSASGSSVTGTYDYQGGKITGAISGNTLNGKWSQQPSYNPPNDAGDLQFTLSTDTTSFTGQWRYGSSGSWSSWNGTCVSSGGGVTASNGSGCSKLILLQGLATDSSSDQPYFADIVNAVGGNYSGITYFSYNPNNPQGYSEQDSLQSDAKSVDALHATVMREIAACNSVTLDLIGHSNGGVVALQYLAKYGTSPEASHIRHVITLDSSVNGLSYNFLNGLVLTAGLLGYDLSYLLNAPAIQDTIAMFNDSGTPQRNINLARSLSGKIAVLTMGSDNDLIVPFQSASIPGFSSEWSLDVMSSLCPTYVDACVGHNEILHDPGVISKIASFLATGP
jgi:pimeloyl-ACP methyl ester carboxylesterase